ncbi:MAG: hypothetical protein COA78_19050 [Blastopirellula sp.]|nr:MAG: hypothetical protein COA78_19050 [Blastopirellula sp.]
MSNFKQTAIGLYAIAVLVSLAGTAFAQQPNLDSLFGEVQGEPGFYRLFNGSDLTGWDGRPDCWTVRDGAIWSTGNGKQRNWLIRRDIEATDFELRMQFRFVDGNSGVQVRSKDIGDWQVRGYQVEIAEHQVMGLWHHSLMSKEDETENTRKHLATAGQRVSIDEAGKKQVTQFAKPDELTKTCKDGEWNNLTVIARGPRLIQKVNGRVFAELTDHQKGFASREGLIALQDHGKGTIAAFRNIRIRLLKPEKGNKEKTADDSAKSDSRPDILLIMIDDLRPKLGCYHDPHVLTPNIDRLARRAVVFDRAYCQYAKCGASRLSLMTGLRPDSIGVYGHGKKGVEDFRSRRADAVSIAKWLKQHGYHTQSFGKIDHDGWQVADDWSAPPSPGRENEILEIVDPNDSLGPTIIAERFSCPAIQSPDVADDKLFAGRMTGQVIEALNSRDLDQPMFLAVGYRRPHLPLVAPRRYFDLYQPDKSWLAKNPAPAKESPVMAWFNSVGYVGFAKKQGLKMPTAATRQEAMLWSGYELRSYTGVPNHGEIPTPVQLQVLQAYAACISYVDAQVGQLLDALERSQRLDHTIVILCSDHGWHLGEQSAWTKMTNFEVATRVPLLISAPGVKSGRSRMPSELVDLYPTICELAGLPLPEHLEGESLANELRQPGSEPQQQFALSQHARYKEKYMGRAVRSDRFRFVQWTETQTGKVVESELYDHKNDPHETVNVAQQAEYAHELKRLEKLLEAAFRAKVTTK